MVLGREGAEEQGREKEFGLFKVASRGWAEGQEQPPWRGLGNGCACKEEGEGGDREAWEGRGVRNEKCLVCKNQSISMGLN